MDTSQWTPQPFEEIVTSSSSCAPKAVPAIERKPRPHKEQALNCPGCNSTNTKFCYYNNYSLTQPRYFCKTCRRYWTEGGSLRNIPVGGGSRKNGRSSPSSSSKKLPDLVNPSAGKVVLKDRDLNLGFPTVSKVIQALTDIEKFTANVNGSGQVSAMELLSRITNSSSRGLTDSFLTMPVPDPAPIYRSGFDYPDFKPREPPPWHARQWREGGLFPFEDLKAVSEDVNHDQQSKEPGDPTSEYWKTGMLGG